MANLIIQCRHEYKQALYSALLQPIKEVMTFHTCKLFKSLQAYQLIANRNDCEFTQLHVYSTLLRNNNPGDRVREITLTFCAHGEIVRENALFLPRPLAGAIIG